MGSTQPSGPLLVLVSGPAATGKTTLAKTLGEMTSLPVLCKDDIKESLFDTLGHQTPQWVDQLEVATYDVLFLVSRALLRASQSHIIESDVAENFNEKSVGPLVDEFGCRVVQLACETDGEVLVQRFTDRMSSQHPGHYESYYWEHAPEFRQSLQVGAGRTLDIDSDVIRVDTTDFTSIDYDDLVDRLQTAAGR